MSHHRAPEPGPPTRGPHGPPPGHQLAPDHARSRQPVGSWAAWAPPPLAEPDRGWARLPRPAVGTRDIETPPDPILYAAPTGHYSRDRHVSLPRTWTAPEPLVARRPVLPLVRPPTSPWARDFALDTVRGLPQPERTLYPPPIARLHLPPSAEARVTDDAPTRIPAVGVPRSESAVPASDTPIPWREWFNQYSGVGSPPNTPNVPGLPGFGDILPRRAEAAHLIAPTAPSAQYHGLSTAPGSFDRSDPRVQFPFERLTRPQAVETPIEPRTSRETVDPPPRPPDDLDSPLNSGTLISPVTPFAASDVSTKLDKGELPAGIYSYRSNLRHPDSKRSKRLRRLSFDKEYHPSRRSRKVSIINDCCHCKLRCSLTRTPQRTTRNTAARRSTLSSSPWRSRYPAWKIYPQHESASSCMLVNTYSSCRSGKAGCARCL